MAGIEFNFDGQFTNDMAGTSTTNSSSTCSCSIESILRSIKQLKELCQVRHPIIYVWKGNAKSFCSLLLTEKPRLILFDLIDSRQSYLFAGVGVVAGAEAYEFLKKNQVELRWSDYFIPLGDEMWYHYLESQ